MKCRRFLAILLSVSLIFSAFTMAIVYADGEAAEQYTTVSEISGSEISTETPGETPDETPGETPPETPEDTPEETPGETPEEPLFDPAAAYEALMLLETEEEIDAFLAALTDEEYAALEAYILQETGASEDRAVTVPFTDAGPLLPPVTLEDLGTPPDALSDQTGAFSVTPMDEEEDALVLDKTAAENKNIYSVTMEAYTTGQVTSVTQNVPCDIILVLDQSGSMADDFDGDWTNDNTERRQYAMKQAVCAFIEDVADRYTQEGNHRIGVVTYASGSSRLSDLTYVTAAGETTLTDVINGLPDEPSGSTNVAAGMTVAKTIFDGDTVAGTRQRVVIVFTDGVPTTSNTFDIEVADNAISTGKALKHTGVTIYTIGIFNGADKDELYGDLYEGTSSWSFNDEVPAANRFMNYLSGNYPLAENVGLIEEYIQVSKHDWRHVFTITDDYDRVDDDLNYYLTANDQDTLDDIFTSISTQISTPNITLGTNAVVRDVISQYFEMPETEDVAVYTVDYQGGDSWDAPATAVGVTVSIDEDSRTVDVSGFDFDSNYITETSRDESFYGRKIVVVITLSPRAGFAGGNGVPTNIDTSGIYTAPEAEAAVETFPVPTVDVPISFDFVTNDKSIYLLGDIAVTDLYTPVDMSGWQYDFVDEASYVASAVISNTASGSYNITVTVSPSFDGEYGTVSVTNSVLVHVFFPKVTYRDSTIYLGESPDYNANFISLVWSCTDGSSIGSPSGLAPALNYSYTPGAAPFACDTDIDAAVTLGNINITMYVIFAWQADGGCNCTQVPEEAQFRVHIKTCTLTVSKKGAESVDENQSFIFRVTGTPGAFNAYVDLTVTVQGNGNVTLCGLPIGTYTVTEDSGWSWRYTPDASKTETLSSGCDTSEVNIINTRDNPYWLNGCSAAVNDFWNNRVVRDAAIPSHKHH